MPKWKMKIILIESIWFVQRLEYWFYFFYFLKQNFFWKN